MTHKIGDMWLEGEHLYIYLGESKDVDGLYGDNRYLNLCIWEAISQTVYADMCGPDDIEDDKLNINLADILKDLMPFLRDRVKTEKEYDDDF